jgi:hypothetical protein
VIQRWERGKRGRGQGEGEGERRAERGERRAERGEGRGEREKGEGERRGEVTKGRDGQMERGIYNRRTLTHRWIYHHGQFQ